MFSPSTQDSPKVPGVVTAYICGCGDQLSVYEIDPESITDVGAERREDTGAFYCPECEQDYEPVEAVPVSAFLSDEVVGLMAERYHGGQLTSFTRPIAERDMRAAVTAAIEQVGGGQGGD